LKTLPEDILVDIFWKTLVESDVSPLTKEEREAIWTKEIELVPFSRILYNSCGLKQEELI
jgi:hypothetical protein